MDRAEGAYRLLSFSLRSLFCFAAHAIDVFAFPFLTTLVVFGQHFALGSIRLETDSLWFSQDSAHGRRRPA